MGQKYFNRSRSHVLSRFEPCSDSCEFRTVLRRSRQTLPTDQCRQSARITLPTMGSTLSWLHACQPPFHSQHSDSFRLFGCHLQNVGYLSDLTRQALSVLRSGAVRTSPPTSSSPSRVATSTACPAGKATSRRSSSEAILPNRSRASLAASKSSTTNKSSSCYRTTRNSVNATNGSSSKPSFSPIEQHSGVRARTARLSFE